MRATIRGADRLKDKLAALGAVGAGRALVTALRAAALPIQNEAKRRAPYRSGTLSRGITTEVLSQGATRARVAVSTSRIPYARIQEYGGTIRAKAGGWLVFRGKSGNFVRVRQVTIPARPYLRPAFDTQKDAAVAEFGAALRDLIDEAIR
jgi:HK97 gp10 family phage protein